MENNRKTANKIIKYNQNEHCYTHNEIITVEEAINRYKKLFKKLSELNKPDNYTKELTKHKYDMMYELRICAVYYLNDHEELPQLRSQNEGCIYDVKVDEEALYFSYYDQNDEKITMKFYMEEYLNMPQIEDPYNMFRYAVEIVHTQQEIKSVEECNSLKEKDSDYLESKYKKLIRIFPLRLIDGNYITIQMDIRRNVDFKLVEFIENDDNVIIPLDKLSNIKRKKILSMLVDADSIPNYVSDKDIFNHMHLFDKDFSTISKEYNAFIGLEKSIFNLTSERVTERPEWLDDLKIHYSNLPFYIDYLKQESDKILEDIVDKKRLTVKYKNDSKLQKQIDSLRENYAYSLQSIQDAEKSHELIGYIIEKFDIQSEQNNNIEIKGFELKK